MEKDVSSQFHQPWFLIAGGEEGKSGIGEIVHGERKEE
jgi:hypothetical protein